MKTFFALLLLVVYVSAECLPSSISNGEPGDSCLVNSGSCSDSFACTAQETCTASVSFVSDFEAFADTATRPPGGAYYGQNFCTNIAEGAGDQSCNQPNNCLPGVPIGQPGFCHCLNCVFSECHLIRPDSVESATNPLRGCLEPELDCWKVGDNVFADPVANGVAAITDCFHGQRPPSDPLDGSTYSGAAIHLADGPGRQGSIVKTVEVDCSAAYSVSFWMAAFSDQSCPQGVADPTVCDVTGTARSAQRQISRLAVSLDLPSETISKFYHYDSSGWDKTTAPWYFIQVTFRPADRGNMTITLSDVTTSVDGIPGWGILIDDLSIQAFDCCSNTPTCADNTTITIDAAGMIDNTNGVDLTIPNECTRDFCSPEVGCINSFELTDGRPCYYTQRAGQPNVCDTLLCGCGMCGIGNGNVTCSDGDVNTTDECVTGVGCVYTPITCPVPCTRNNVTQTEPLNGGQQLLLDEHNAERADLCLDDLLWDAALQAQAQAVVDTCLFSRSGYGSENVAAGEGFPSPIAIVENWQSAKQYYDCETQSCTNGTNSCLAWQRYTAENATQIGCAWRTCPASSNPFGNAADWDFYVCHYDVAPLGNTEEFFCDRLDCSLPFNATAPPGLCDPAGCTQPANPNGPGDAAVNPEEANIVDLFNARRTTLCTHNLEIDNALSTQAATDAAACDFAASANPGVVIFAGADTATAADMADAWLSGGASYDCNSNTCTADPSTLIQQPATPVCSSFLNVVSESVNNVGCAVNTGCPLPLGGTGSIGICYFDAQGAQPGVAPLADCSRNVCP